MSRKTLGMISGRVRVADIGNLDSGRYEFLSLENAEPNPGAPSSNNGILGSATDGTRSWLIPNQGLSVSGSNDLFVDETGVPIDTTGYNYSTSNVLSDVLADLDQNVANAIAGSLNAVATDSTLIGDGTSSNPLSVVSTVADADTLDGEDGTYYLNYNNFTNTPTIGDGTLTVASGSGLVGTGSFDANATANTTVTLDHADTSSVSDLTATANTFVDSLSFDTFGHVTGYTTSNAVSANDANDSTIEISAGSGLTTGGDFTTNQATNKTITLDHADTSSQSSVNNSDGVVIQDVTLDTFGHVTGLSSTNLDTRYYTQSSADSTFVDVSGDTMTGALTLAGAPTSNLHATTKKYVDETAQGLNVLPSARVATTTNLNATYSTSANTLTSNVNESLSIDGTTLAVGDNLIVKDQTNAYENGSYVVTNTGSGSTSWVIERCSFCNETSEVAGSFEFVYNGTTNDSTGWVASVPDDFELNNTSASSDSDFSTRGDIAWIQFSGAGTYTAGTGLTLNGSEFSHSDTSGVSDLSASTRTYVDSLSFDTFGHVTGYSTSTETVTDKNDYVSAVDFDTTTGSLTLTRTDSGTITENLDGRYLTSYTETDTLDSVTDRGSLTTNTIGVGGVSIDSSYDLDSDTGSTSSTTQTSVASFSSSAYGSAKMVVQISDSVTGERQISELLVAHDGTNAFATEYGVVYTGSAPLATFDADISSGNVRLLATAASGNSTSYTVSETLLLV